MPGDGQASPGRTWIGQGCGPGCCTLKLVVLASNQGEKKWVKERKKRRKCRLPTCLHSNVFCVLCSVDVVVVFYAWGLGWCTYVYIRSCVLCLECWCSWFVFCVVCVLCVVVRFCIFVFLFLFGLVFFVVVLFLSFACMRLCVWTHISFYMYAPFLLRTSLSFRNYWYMLLLYVRVLYSADCCKAKAVNGDF